MKNVVITGSSRGIGYGLAKEFLKKGNRVTISGRNKDSLEKALSTLQAEISNANIDHQLCDVSNPEDVEKLWQKAASHGPVDIWINNAGIGQRTKMISELEFERIEEIINTNIKGLICSSKVALEHMLEQGKGAIYNMEGFGSDGRKMKSMSIYGTSKYAVRYFTRSMALETKETPVIIGALSPGMVITDLLINPISEKNELNREAVKIFNILADQVETVCPFLVNKMLSNTKNGVLISWLTPWKIMGRFIKNSFVKRKLKGLPDV